MGDVSDAFDVMVLRLGDEPGLGWEPFGATSVQERPWDPGDDIYARPAQWGDPETVHYVFWRKAREKASTPSVQKASTP